MKSEPKTQPTTVPVADFLAQIAQEGRRNDCLAVADLMQQVTGEAPRMWGDSIVGFGAFRYLSASGRSGDWPIVGFSPRKNDLTLYLMPGFQGREALLAKLGKHRIGKSCLYLKKLADVDLAVLESLVRESVSAMDATRIRP